MSFTVNASSLIDGQKYTIAESGCEAAVITPTIVDNTSCAGFNGDIFATTTETVQPSSYTYQLWDAGVTIPQAGDISFVDGTIGSGFSGLAPGNYVLRVINDDTGCETNQAVTILDNATGPSVDVGSAQIIAEHWIYC